MHQAATRQNVDLPYYAMSTPMKQQFLRLQHFFELIDRFIGEGYAIPYPEAVETIRLLSRTEAIILDPSYTAKAMTGMLATLCDGGGRDGPLPVFIHTGGVFGLFAGRDLMAEATHDQPSGYR